jgi:hypothetical protein
MQMLMLYGNAANFSTVAPVNEPNRYRPNSSMPMARPPHIKSLCGKSFCDVTKYKARKIVRKPSARSLKFRNLKVFARSKKEAFGTKKRV